MSKDTVVTGQQQMQWGSIISFSQLRSHIRRTEKALLRPLAGRHVFFLDEMDDWNRFVARIVERLCLVEPPTPTPYRVSVPRESAIPAWTWSLSWRTYELCVDGRDR